MDSCEQVLGDAFNLVETFGFGPISLDHHFDILDIPFTPSRLARIMEKKTVLNMTSLKTNMKPENELF